MDDLVEYLKLHNCHDWAAKVSSLHKQHHESQAELLGLRERVKDAEAANELDRTRVPIAMTELSAAVRSRQWVLDGRGPYEWDDDDYREEFTLWVRDVENALKLFARIAIDWHGCPKDFNAIRHARAALQENDRKS